MQDQTQAMKLVAYASTLGLLAGILYIIPPLAILVFLASLYGLYILYLGIPVFMETPEDKRLIYLIVSINGHNWLDHKCYNVGYDRLPRSTYIK